MFRTEKRRLLPRLWTGRRLALCTVLVALGLAQAAAALIMSLSAAALANDTPETMGLPSPGALMAATALSVALAVLHARLAERFAASYVHDVRMHYSQHVLRGSLAKPDRNIGYVLTRVVNDMSAIKSWLARGLVSFLVTMPMLAAIVSWTWLHEPAFAPAMLVAVMVWLAVTALVWAPLGRAIRHTRNRRGKVAGYAGRAFNTRRDVLMNGRFAGIIGGLARRSTHLTHALVRRAMWSGGLRSAGVLVFPAAILAFLTLRAEGAGAIDAGAMTSFLMIMAFISAQLTALSSGLEFFQSSRVAFEKVRAILRRPAMDLAQGDRLPIAAWRTALSVTDLPVSDGGDTLTMTFQPGSRHDLSHLAPQVRAALRSALLGLSSGRRHARIGETGFDALQLADIWRRVKAFSCVDAEGWDIERLTRRSRLSAAKTQHTLMALGLDAGNAGLAATSLRLRAARILLANPAVVMLDDPRLLEDHATAQVLVDQLTDRGAIVLMECGPPVGRPRSLKAA